jgi:hypothetical protein
MKWFLSISAATFTALVVGLALALPGSPWPERSQNSPHTRLSGCRNDPDWFVAIHEYYNCNPRITPDFDFASLYSGMPTGASLYSGMPSGATVPNPRDMRRQR